MINMGRVNNLCRNAIFCFLNKMTTNSIKTNSIGKTLYNSEKASKSVGMDIAISQVCTSDKIGCSGTGLIDKLYSKYTNNIQIKIITVPDWNKRPVPLSPWHNVGGWNYKVVFYKTKERQTGTNYNFLKNLFKFWV